ncbi:MULTISPECIES: hypothetical protein [Actinoalloteichus]|uniref:Uncharacterized protein n=1 Tax=Actinoalloteichus caeruleus DSM 43889 TaxID=1120930 RepID=A0ABT1JJ18_ACTCY|nr:hypothetical protein [Actinoalloteichus caeruleus]MCP2332478.1 hypothetical protein [Actinoalloteichus caeruleus DSM 43889]
MSVPEPGARQDVLAALLDPLDAVLLPESDEDEFEEDEEFEEEPESPDFVAPSLDEEELFAAVPPPELLLSVR